MVSQVHYVVTIRIACRNEQMCVVLVTVLMVYGYPFHRLS